MVYNKTNNAIPLESEKSIFEFLQLPYLTPEKR